jgi:Carboxypeptidase regulatory-like domain
MKIRNLNRSNSNRWFSLRYLLILLVFLVGLPFRASAQEGTIVGTVTDPSGSVVANVKITATNTDTGKIFSTASNETGQYVAPELKIGHYNLKAEAAGFKAAERKGIVLTVGDRVRVDFQLAMGATSETITVEATAVHVQTDSGEVSALISGEQVSQISTNGRSIYSLTILTPGASSNMPDFQVATPVGGNSQVSFNGQRYAHNIYLLDGGEDLDRGGSGTISVMPSVDAIGEFRALTSNYSADYGLSSAGTMTMVIKSGTSQIHASAWEFNRNDAFDARAFFNPAPQKVAELRLNVWGFNVGGPVTFGKLYNPEKKKTFFFYNMEWRRLIQGGVINQPVPATSQYPTAAGANFGTTAINVPSAAAVSPGVLFANCPGGVAPAGVVQGSPFPGNVIPACMISANATALLNAGIFPKANGVNTAGAPTFLGGNNSPTDVKEEIARIDHNFNSKFSIFGHWISEQISQGYGTSQWSSDNLPTVQDTFGNPSYSAVIHSTYIISPTLLNELAFNYNGNRINIVPAAGSGLASLALPTGFTESRLFTGPNNLDRIPSIQLAKQTGANFDISSWPWHNKADDYQIRDDVSWTKGAHQIRMGGSWALYKKIQDLFGTTQGTFNFNGAFTGSDFADFLLGEANTYNELAVQDHGYWNNVSWAAYVQDNWRVNHRLTVNLGLRWDGVPHTYEANDRMGNFYPQLYNTATPAVLNANGTINQALTAPSAIGTSPNPILAGVPLYLNGIGIPGQCYSGFCVPKGLVNNHWAAFGPRIGFAYDVTGSGKTVVRGGFGMMYERIQGNDMYNAGPNIPFSLSPTLSSVSLDSVTTNLLTGPPAAGTSVIPFVPAGIQGLQYNNYKLPVSYQYSFGVQRSLTSRTVLSLAYVGNQTRHQSDLLNYNLVPQADLPGLINKTLNYVTAPGLVYPGFGQVLQAQNEANGHYNSFQASLNGNVTKDLQLQAAYTWSSSIDPSTGANGNNGDLDSVANPYLGWRYDVGPSQLDRTNIFIGEFVYDIPLFRNASSRFVKTALGGWQVSGVITAESGLPVNIVMTGGQATNGLPGQGNNAANRPNVNGAVSYPHTPAEWFNTAAFTAPVVGQYGNTPFDNVRGPGRDNWNISLFKNFVLSESRGSRLELRFESFNTWNHTQFNNVSNGLGSSNFGQVTSAFDPRIFQFGGKIYF